jgi:hypothetical protein
LSPMYPDFTPGERELTHPEGARPAPEMRRTAVEPLTSQESRLHVTVSPAFLALLKKAKAGQGHVQPRATDEQVLTVALELLVAQQEKRKASVPAKVKREVRARDGGRCQWKLASGGVCGSTVRLEIDHVVPRGKGGPSTEENCRILCRAHNLESARAAYGDALMDRYARSTVARETSAVYGGSAVRAVRASRSAGSIARAARKAARAPSTWPSRARYCPCAVASLACSGAIRRAVARVDTAPSRSSFAAWNRA